MLIINKELWDTDDIIKLHTTKWEKDSHLITNCSLKEIKKLIQDSANNNSRCVLIVDCDKSEFPPFMQVLKIAKFFYGMRTIIKAGLDYTIMYIKNENHKKWINRILKIYSPARPLHILNSKKEIKEMLSQRSQIKK